MKNRTHRLLTGIGTIIIWESVRAVISMGMVSRADAQRQTTAKDNAELTRLYQQDQADRITPDNKQTDWKIVSARDRQRESRVKELYNADKLQTGADYYHAAMVLQHAPAPDDYLLSHELCVAAISKGEQAAKWLAAASEDRFLMNLNRPQRFATQYRSENNGPVRLYQVGSGVTDGLRRVMNVPPLAEAQKREAMFNPPRPKSPAPKPPTSK